MEIFAISPASSKPLWLLGIICVLLLAIFLALAFTAYSSQTSRVEIDSTAIKLVGDFWGRTIPLSALNLADTKILDLDERTEFSPRRRTLGTGLPGYASGWFRLSNGDKALIYVSDRKNVVHIPTSAGYALLLSVDEPEQLIETLKRRGAQT